MQLRTVLLWLTISLVSSTTLCAAQGISPSGQVTISPSRAPLTLKQRQQFKAFIQGVNNPSFTWSVDGIIGGNSSVGTVSSTGLYTPPSQAGTFTVTASYNGPGGGSASATTWVTTYPGMLNYHGDKYRSGVNGQEYALTATTVNESSFGKLFSYSLDGQVYAQPLYLANVNFNGTYRNVLYVATQHDGVYALNADAKASPIWYQSFINPGQGITTFSQPKNGLISPEVGITSTPVIDASTQTLYVLALTIEHGTAVHRLHALNLLTGAEKFNGPIKVGGSYHGATFNSKYELQRPALLLYQGTVYISFGSYGDYAPWQGWVLGYSASGGSLHQVGVFCTAPAQGKAALWMSGGGPAADDSGYIYVVTGNGPFDLNTGGKDAGETVLKLTTSLQVADYYTPSNWSQLATQDWDLGSGGIMLPPTQGSTNMVIIGGKDGKIYLINRSNMGHYSATHDPALEKLSLGQPETNGNFFTPSAWHSWIYFGAVGTPLEQFTFNNGLLPQTPSSHTAEKFAYPGTTPMISSNGTETVVWTLDNSAYFGGTPNGGVNTPGPAVLHAYRGDDLAIELYNSQQAGSRDTGGTAIKFTAPTIANGHVYVGGAGTLTVYGLLP